MCVFEIHANFISYKEIQPCGIIRSSLSTQSHIVYPTKLDVVPVNMDRKIKETSFFRPSSSSYLPHHPAGSHYPVRPGKAKVPASLPSSWLLLLTQFCALKLNAYQSKNVWILANLFLCQSATVMKSSSQTCLFVKKKNKALRKE